MRWAPDLLRSSATHFQPLLVDIFVSAGVTAKHVWFLCRFDMPYVSSLSRSARSPSFKFTSRSRSTLPYLDGFAENRAYWVILLNKGVSGEKAFGTVGAVVGPVF